MPITENIKKSPPNRNLKMKKFLLNYDNEHFKGYKLKDTTLQ